ncbi:hypothetical protein Hdeb2414_s0007g00235091 [Helianthus debilis subsp. tardiflorus]
MVVVDKPTLLGFWDVVAEKDTWNHELSKGMVSTIVDPLHRYLHWLNRLFYHYSWEEQRVVYVRRSIFLLLLLVQEAVYSRTQFGALLRLRKSSAGAQKVVRRRLRQCDTHLFGYHPHADLEVYKPVNRFLKNRLKKKPVFFT